MVDITVVILTKNESNNLPSCLDSIKDFAKRIVIVDSGSEDNTIEIAKDFKADVYEHVFENYAKQFNWALDNTDIKTKWTMRLDADERLTPALKEELEYLMLKHDRDEDEISGITMEAWLYFMGKKIKYGGPKKRKLMVFKTGFGRIESRHMDEHTYLIKGKSVSTREKFLHYDFKNITFFIDKLNWYASREVFDYFEHVKGIDKTESSKLHDVTISKTRMKKDKIYYNFPSFVRSWLLFIYFYIFRLGFLDGKEGFIYHYLYQRWYRLLVDVKIYEKNHENQA